MLRRTVPDEQGWWWAESAQGKWFMAFVDTRDETVAFWDGDDPVHPPFCCDLDAPNANGCVRWIGPLSCPGGPFHSAIHEFDAVQHDEAGDKVLAALVLDFTHADSPQGVTIVSGRLSVDEAWDAMRKVFPGRDD